MRVKIGPFDIYVCVPSVCVSMASINNLFHTYTLKSPSWDSLFIDSLFCFSILARHRIENSQYLSCFKQDLSISFLVRGSSLYVWYGNEQGKSHNERRILNICVKSVIGKKHVFNNDMFVRRTTKSGALLSRKYSVGAYTEIIDPKIKSLVRSPFFLSFYFLGETR